VVYIDKILLPSDNCCWMPGQFASPCTRLFYPQGLLRLSGLSGSQPRGVVWEATGVARRETCSGKECGGNPLSL